MRPATTPVVRAGRHGYADAEIRAVLGGNIYRVLQSVWIA
jgi:microsomal dipeptidase-like Zn-dependent dipeptidase